jgi:phospholipid/cholesterol/gamma-HCH transport system substrate-binding protein
MIPFRERNPIPIGIVGVAVIVSLVAVAFRAQDLPIIGCGTTYHANFTDASGLRSQDDVRVAGVKIGKVTGLTLDNKQVRVAFCVKGARLGDATTAAIKIKTLLGQKYVALDPQGDGKLKPNVAIPLSRTTTPFDVTTAFIGLAKTIEDIDTKQLSTAFNTLSDTFKDSPDSVKASLTGLQRLSTTVASRDTALRSLLQHAKGVTDVLAARNTEVVKLIDDGDLLLRTVQEQRAVIHDLLVNTARLADQLTKLVAENRTRLGPALTNLQRTLTILNDQQVHLDRTIHLLAPFVRDFANTLGNGRWFDTFIANLPGAVVKTEPSTVGATK